MNRQMRRGMVFLAIALVTLLVPFLAFIGQVVPSSPASDSGDPKTDLAVCEGGIIPDEALVTSNKFSQNSLASSKLKWSDSVSTPFAESEPEPMLDELMTENGGNPTLLLMNVEGLSSIVIDDEGTTIGDINPCFGEFIELAKTGGMDGSFILDGDKVVEDVTYTAQRVNTLLLRLNLGDVVIGDSLWNWHIGAREALTVGNLPIATLNGVEEQGREFLRLDYVTKTGECLFVIGYNTGDKRLVGLACETSITPPPGGGPECTGICTPTDVCPNIEGNQSSVPDGKYIGDDGLCHEQKHEEDNVEEPDGVDQQPADEPEPEAPTVQTPAPVTPSDSTDASDQTAPGANPNPSNPSDPPATVVPQAPSNDSDGGTSVVIP